MRKHANFVATVSVGALVIGINSDAWFRLGIGLVVAGIIGFAIAGLVYAWLPKEQRHEHADKRRHVLKVGVGPLPLLPERQAPAGDGHVQGSQLVGPS